MSINEAELKKHLCWAGRWAFLEGLWVGIMPCTAAPIHAIAAPGGPTPILLCDQHFQEVNAAGYIEEPFIDPDEFHRRRRQEGFE